MIHPGRNGPAGEALTIDFVRFGALEAQRLAFFTCGTHGLEAAAGSATFLQWLDRGGASALPGDTALILVHPVNPYGWAYGARGDESIVDINCNCFDRTILTPDNAAYRKLHGRMMHGDASDTALREALESLRSFCDRNRARLGFQGLTARQYEFQDGLSYSGVSPSWSYKAIRGILDGHGRGARKVIAIDWHTGIGDYGDPFIIVNADSGSPVAIRAGNCWGEQYVHTDDIYASGTQAAHTGLLMAAVEQEFRNLGAQDVISAVIEWGTYDIDTMLKALLVDCYLRSCPASESQERCDRLRLDVIEKFCPSDPVWRQAVLHHANRIFNQTIACLAEQ
jgi:hypothetical protein